jgi:hypothetical protein
MSILSFDVLIVFGLALISGILFLVYRLRRDQQNEQAAIELHPETEGVQETSASKASINER